MELSLTKKEETDVLPLSQVQTCLKPFERIDNTDKDSSQGKKLSIPQEIDKNLIGSHERRLDKSLASPKSPIKIEIKLDDAVATEKQLRKDRCGNQELQRGIGTLFYFKLFLKEKRKFLQGEHLKEEHLMFILQSILNDYCQLSAKGFCHGDINSNNIILKEEDLIPTIVTDSVIEMDTLDHESVKPARTSGYMKPNMKEGKRLKKIDVISGDLFSIGTVILGLAFLDYEPRGLGTTMETALSVVGEEKPNLYKILQILLRQDNLPPVSPDQVKTKAERLSTSKMDLREYYNEFKMFLTEVQASGCNMNFCRVSSHECVFEKHFKGTLSNFESYIESDLIQQQHLNINDFGNTCYESSLLLQNLKKISLDLSLLNEMKDEDGIKMSHPRVLTAETVAQSESLVNEDEFDHLAFSGPIFDDLETNSRNLRKLQKLDFNSTVDVALPRKSYTRSSHVRNIPGALMSAIKNGTRKYFGDNRGRFNLGCISHVLQKKDYCTNNDFRKFIEKYDNHDNTFSRINTYIITKGNEEMALILGEIISGLLSLHNDQDLHQWLSNSKIHPNSIELIKRSRSWYAKKFEDIINNQIKLLRTREKLIIEDQPIIHNETIEHSSEIPVSSASCENDNLSIKSHTTQYAIEHSFEDSITKNVPGNLLIIIIRGIRYCFDLDGEKFKVLCISEKCYELNLQEKKQLEAFVKAGGQKKTWKGIREKARSYYPVLDILRDMFARLLSDENIHDLQTALLESKMAERMKIFIKDNRYKLREAAFKHLM